MQKIKHELHAFFVPIIEQFGVDFVDLEAGGSTRKVVIKVFVDEIGGISIDKCARISKALHEVMDAPESPITGDYRLEVSSPGIDRPLKSERDFLRNVGRQVEVITLNDEHTFSGELVAVVEQNIELVPEGGKPIKVPIAEIKRAMIQIKWS